MRPEPLPFDLTLLGYGTNVYPLLVEVGRRCAEDLSRKIEGANRTQFAG